PQTPVTARVLLPAPPINTVIQNRYLVRSIIFLIALVVSVPAHAASSKLDRALRKAVDTHSSQRQPVIVRAKAGQIAVVRNWLKAHGAAGESEQPAINALTPKLSVDALNQLAALLETDTVSFNAPVTSFGSTKNTTPSSPAVTVLR